MRRARTTDGGSDADASPACSEPASGRPMAKLSQMRKDAESGMPRRTRVPRGRIGNPDAFAGGLGVTRPDSRAQPLGLATVVCPAHPWKAEKPVVAGLRTCRRSRPEALAVPSLARRSRQVVPPRVPQGYRLTVAGQSRTYTVFPILPLTRAPTTDEFVVFGEPRSPDGGSMANLAVSVWRVNPARRDVPGSTSPSTERKMGASAPRLP